MRDTRNPQSIIDEIELGRERYAMAETVVKLMEGMRKDYLPNVKMWDAFTILLIARRMLQVHMRGQKASAAGISRAIGVSRTTVQRKLAQLKKMGAVEQQGARYSIVPAFMNSPHMVGGFRRRRDILKQAALRAAQGSPCDAHELVCRLD